MEGSGIIKVVFLGRRLVLGGNNEFMGIWRRRFLAPGGVRF